MHVAAATDVSSFWGAFDSSSNSLASTGTGTLENLLVLDPTLKKTRISLPWLNKYPFHLENQGQALSPEPVSSDNVFRMNSSPESTVYPSKEMIMYNDNVVTFYVTVMDNDPNETLKIELFTNPEDPFFDEFKFKITEMNTQILSSLSGLGAADLDKFKAKNLRLFKVENDWSSGTSSSEDDLHELHAMIVRVTDKAGQVHGILLGVI